MHKAGEDSPRLAIFTCGGGETVIRETCVPFTGRDCDTLIPEPQLCIGRTNPV